MFPIYKIFGVKLVKKVLISTAEYLAKKTDNDLDDKLVKTLKKALKKI